MKSFLCIWKPPMSFLLLEARLAPHSFSEGTDNSPETFLDIWGPLQDEFEISSLLFISAEGQS